MSTLEIYVRRLRHMSWVMVLTVAALLVTGVFFVYSACFISEQQEVRTLYVRQMLWAVMGLGVFVAVALTDYEHFARHAVWLYGGVVVLLVLVLLIGEVRYGARRWLILFGQQGLTLQPAELAKLAIVLMLARRLERPAHDLRQGRTLLILLILTALPVALILRQPDLGTALVFVPAAFLVMFTAGVPLRWIGALGGVAATVLLLMLAALFLPAQLDATEATQNRFRDITGLREHQIRRIEVFFQPDLDPLGAGWNKRQSEIAIGSGGLRGKGYLKGTQNILGFLPRSVAPTDFIFSVIAEEKGFIGALAVIGLYFVLLMSCLRTALHACDRTGRLICTGILGILFCHVFINIAMTVGLMPVTGLPLPLLSYGGSFMMVTLAGLGLVQSVRIKARLQETYR